MERARSWGRVLLAVVLLGLVLRAYHYLRDPAVWHDEAAAVVNVLEKSRGELLGPLYWAEAAPPLFLWGERAAFLVLGDSTFALRLVPFAASCLTVLLLAWVAWRVLPPWPAVVAALLVAFSDRLLWHACEAKPYATDVLVAAAVLALHVAARTWRLETLLAVHLTLAPVAIWLSYPAAFVLGASLVVLLPRIVASERWTVWAGYGLWALVVLGAFAALALGPARVQRCATMDSCWVNHFPPYAHPAMIPVWTVLSVTEVVRYCFLPVGTALTVLAVVGAVVWVRAGQSALVALCALPLGLALLAAFLRQYPFGASRLEVFATPGLALLIGAGLPPAWGWLAARQRWTPLALTVLLLAGVGMAADRVVVPWYRPDAGHAADYVLAHLAPGDAVFGNKWEHVYYFRTLGPRFTLAAVDRNYRQPRNCSLGGLPDVRSPGRLWVVFADDAPGSRAAVGARLAERHRIRDHRAFPGIDVYLLEAPALGGSAEMSEVSAPR